MKPNKHYYRLDPRQASIVAMRVARLSGAPGEIDWHILREWTDAYIEFHGLKEKKFRMPTQKRAKAKQMALSV
jgi:hypothetical protein